MEWLMKIFGRAKKEVKTYQACKKACEEILQSETLEAAKNLAADALAKGE